MEEQHLRCPNCQQWIEPEPVCPHCNAILLYDKDWLHIYTVSTEWEAALLQGMLESYGIPSIILSQRDSSRQLTVGHLALVRIYVPLPFAIDAFHILASYEADNGTA